MQKILLQGVCVALLLNWGATSRSAVVTPQFLNTLAEEASTNSPGLRASVERLNAAKQERLAVRTWADPEVMLGGTIANREMRAEEGDIMYGVEQELPLFGKPRAEREFADAEVEVADARNDLTFQFLRRDLALAAYTSALAQHEVKLAQEEAAWFRTLQTVAEERYANSAGSQVDALRAQTLAAQSRNMIANAEQELAVASATLDRLLNRAGDEPWPPLELPEIGPSVPFNEKTVRLALTGEPELRLLRQEVFAAEAKTTVTRKNYRPNVALGLEARQFSGGGAFKEGAVVLRMNLPWINRDKYRSDIAKSQALSSAAAADAEDYEAAVRAEVRMLVARIDNARRDALLQKNDIIPRATQTLTAAEAGWRAGEDSLRDVLDSNRMLIEARRAYYRAVAAQYLALSELVLCCGLGDLEALEMLTNEAALPPQSNSQSPLP